MIDKPDSIEQRQEPQKTELIKLLTKTPIIQVACQRVGVSRATFYRWRKDDEPFGKAVDEALVSGNELINDMAESMLIQAIQGGNITAQIFWLKHHHPAYETRLRVDGRLTHETEALTPEQEQLVAKALALAALLPGTTTLEVSNESNK